MDSENVELDEFNDTQLQPPDETAGGSDETPGSPSASASAVELSETFKSLAANEVSELNDWDQDNVRLWLESFNMDHYYPVFANNDWDNGDALLKLNEDEVRNEAKVHFENSEDTEMDEEQIRGVLHSVPFHSMSCQYGHCRHSPSRCP